MAAGFLDATLRDRARIVVESKAAEVTRQVAQEDVADKTTGARGDGRNQVADACFQSD